MISDLPKFANQYLASILPPIWQLLTQMADIYIKVIVNATEENPFVSNSESLYHHHLTVVGDQLHIC